MIYKLRIGIFSLAIFCVFLLTSGRMSVGQPLQSDTLQLNGPSPTPSIPVDLRESIPPTDAGAEVDTLLTRIALNHLPAKFEDDKDWGGQSERWDGIKFRREGLKIETQRRKKVVNHGSWDKVTATLRDPETFKIQIKNIHETDDGKSAFDICVVADLDIVARQAKWVKGVQLYSISATGHAKIQLKVSMEMDVQLGINHFPPDVIFIPVAQSANITIEEFAIDRISKIGGEIAQQVTKKVRSKLDRKIVQHETKLVKKLNKQFEKKQDKLHLSVADAMQSKWSRLVGKLPTPE